MDGYIKLRKASRRYVYYIYLDHADNMADSLFYREHITVRFKGDFMKEGCDWKYVAVKVRKADEQTFLKALKELPNKLLIAGYDGYDDALAWMNSIFEDKI